MDRRLGYYCLPLYYNFSYLMIDYNFNNGLKSAQKMALETRGKTSFNGLPLFFLTGKMLLGKMRRVRSDSLDGASVTKFSIRTL